MDHSRRRFLKGCALALPAAAMMAPWQRAGAAASARSLSFHHTHTGEKLSVVYHDGVDYIPESLAEIDHLLRDFRTDDVHPIDPALFDILSAARSATGGRGTFEIISGYRSPATNSMLRNKSSGVAKKSMHLQGKAIDVRLRGVDTARLRKAAVSLGAGGVGYYAKSDFVHIDTGRVRTW